MPPVIAEISPDALTFLLDGRWAALRRDVRAQMAAEPYRDPVGLDLETHRRTVWAQLKALAATDRPGHPAASRALSAPHQGPGSARLLRDD